MTFREKLAQEHPDRVGSKFAGGCNGCPLCYGYEVGFPANHAKDCKTEEGCARCWDREIPGTEPTKPEQSAKQPPVDRAKLLIALECCRQPKAQCAHGCSYIGNGNCLQTLARDSLAYICYLEEAAAIG